MARHLSVRVGYLPSAGGGDPPAGLDAAAFSAAMSHRFVFAHQSVGMQVIQGIQALADDLGQPDPAVLDVTTTAIPGSGGFVGHWYAGTNGDPATKTADFDTRIRGGLHSSADVFVLKFCYADLRSSSTDSGVRAALAQSVFDNYEAVIDGLRASYPAKTFIAATETIVMSTDEDGPNNDLRMMFNDHVRAKYGTAGPLWDIALALSTDPEGNRVTHVVNGQTVEALYSGYASADQEHISGTASIGRKAAATPLLLILAGL